MKFKRKDYVKVIRTGLFDAAWENKVGLVIDIAPARRCVRLRFEARLNSKEIDYCIWIHEERVSRVTPLEFLALQAD